MLHLVFIGWLGVFSGFLCVPFVTHWVRLLMASLGRYPGGHPSGQPLPQRYLRLFAVLHPTPWLLLVGVPWGIYSLVSNPPSKSWVVYFICTAIGLVGVFAFSTIYVLRILAKHKAGVAT